MASKTLKLPLPEKLGRIIPVAGVVYNPTHEWLEAVWRFHHAKDQLRDGKRVPHYGGSKVDAVLVMGGDLEDPKTNVAIQYRDIRWPGDTTVLGVFELEDDTLWEEMTDFAPQSIEPDPYYWSPEYKRRECLKLIGPHVKLMHLLKPLSNKGLRLHESRLPRRKK